MRAATRADPTRSLRRRRLAAGLLAALALGVASLAGNPLPYAAAVALTPLAIALRREGARVSAQTFGLFGFGWWVGATWWLVPAVVRFSGSHLVTALAVFGGTCVVLALPYAAFGALYGMRPRAERHPVVAAAGFAACVALGATLVPGSLAHGLYRAPALIQIAELGGVPAVDFALALVGFGLADAVDASSPPGVRRRGAAIAVLVPLAVLAYGLVRLSSFAPERLARLGHRPLVVAIVQPNLGRESDPEAMLAQARRIRDAREKPDLVVLPEVSARYTYTDHTFLRAHTEELARALGVPLTVVSSYVFLGPPTEANPNPGYTNTLHVLGEDGAERGRYSKNRLVPFFEYLPLERELPFLRQLFPDALRYVPGEPREPLEILPGVRVIPAICYEILFHAHVDTFAARGGNLIVNPANDAWLGGAAASERHLSLGLFRTVEQRVPWVRATNSGVSVAVDASGSEVKGSRTTLWRRETRVVELFVPPEPSRAAATARTLFLGVLVAVAALGFARRRRQGPG